MKKMNMAENVDNKISSEELLIADLINIGCCDACILRFLNSKAAHDWSNPSATIAKLLSKSINDDCEESPAKNRKKNPCSACLGLLQTSEREKQIKKIINDVEMAGYDAKDVTFALSLPVSMMVRNTSAWLYVRDKFYSYFLDRQRYDDIYGLYGDMKADNNVISIKEAWKSLLGQDLAHRLGKTLNPGTNSQFFVNVHFNYPEDEKEAACMIAMHPDVFGDRKSQKRKYHDEVVTRKSVEQALGKTERELFEAHCTIPPEIPNVFLTCSNIVCSHDSLYLAGRYNKFSRTLSQTPWMINGERRMESSVEELIKSPIATKIPHDVIRFSSSGREDVDVRMLGRGRPFVLDVVNPRITQLSYKELRDLEMQINTSTSSVFVRDLQIVPKEDLIHIKSGEQTKTKTYHCYCIAKLNVDADVDATMGKIESLNSRGAFVINQRTPLRVLHRRPLAVRPRTVHWINAQCTSNDKDQIFFKMSTKVEAGTYVKELVHGDLGRTVPNISLMLELDADILALDVEEIDLEWPPLAVDMDLTIAKTS